MNYLRSGGRVTEDIRALLVDLLDGSLRPSRSKRRGMVVKTPEEWGRLIKAHREDLLGKAEGFEGEPEEWWQAAVAAANEAGYQGTPRTKGEATKAAKAILCRLYGISDNTLRGQLYPAPRKKL
ncbi:hypothetical protein ACFODL_08870 [Phenylobacterium terrae]|uniref:hypothetical protein n=1 Tax=Phenylobacterium terrae TaxID=2665495 RepID=UPI00361B3683